MKRKWVALLLVLILIPTCALAGRQYILPDSDTRALSKEELREWDYESLGYILNEIFARHGYCFIPGEKYDNYFSAMPWYTPNANTDNTAACYPKLSSLEWANEKLVKQVRAEMRAQSTRNSGGKHYLDYISFDSMDVLSGFSYTSMTPGQKLKVYSAPSSTSYRGANGKAVVSTNGSVYVAGWEKGWLLLMYETNSGSVRVGYVNSANIKGKVNAQTLDFAYSSVPLIADANLTDDPAASMTTLLTLKSGTSVTYLSAYQNARSWAYIETTLGNQTVRGFIPYSALNLGSITDENDD